MFRSHSAWTIHFIGDVMSKLPLVSQQLVLRIKAFGKFHDARRQQLSAANVTAYSTLDKKAIVVVLKDRVAPGSDHRKLPSDISGGTLRIQANECGPFGSPSGFYAQIVCDEEGKALEPIVDFNKLKSGFCAAGGHRAIFEAPTLIVVKAYQDKDTTSIARLTPVVEGNEVWIKDDILHMVKTGDPLPDELSRFNDAYAATQARLREVNTTQLFYSKG